jgi:hypothetical protein
MALFIITTYCVRHPNALVCLLVRLPWPGAKVPLACYNYSSTVTMQTLGRFQMYLRITLRRASAWMGIINENPRQRALNRHCKQRNAARRVGAHGTAGEAQDRSCMCAM